MALARLRAVQRALIDEYRAEYFCDDLDVPASAFGWMAIVVPWRAFDSRLRADSRRVGKVQVDEAASGALQGLVDADRDVAGAGECAETCEPSVAEKEAASWVASAIPELGDARASKLTGALVSEGLTPARLKAFARLRSADATTALIHVLDFAEVSLSRGERLAIATAVLSEAESG